MLSVATAWQRVVGEEHEGTISKRELDVASKEALLAKREAALAAREAAAAEQQTRVQNELEGSKGPRGESCNTRVGPCQQGRWP